MVVAEPDQACDDLVPETPGRLEARILDLPPEGLGVRAEAEGLHDLCVELGDRD
jgi:hypothetical protein